MTRLLAVFLPLAVLALAVFTATALAEESDGGAESTKLADLSKIFAVRFRDGGLHVDANRDQDFSAVQRELMKSGKFRSIRVTAPRANWSASMGGSNRKGALVIDLGQEDRPELEVRFERDGGVVLLRIVGSRVHLTHERDDGETFRLLRTWKTGASLYLFEGDRARDAHAATLGELMLQEPVVEQDLLGCLRDLGLEPEVNRFDPRVVRYVTGPPAPIEGHAATRVESLVAALGADDFAARDEARAALSALARDPAFARYLVRREPEINGLESRGRVAKILAETGGVAARFRLIRDEKLETDREYLTALAKSRVESVRTGAERLLAALDVEDAE